MTVIEPSAQTYKNDTVYILVILKMFDSINKYRLAVKFKKLLWFCLCIHSLTGSAGKNYSYIHLLFLFVFFLPFSGK